MAAITFPPIPGDRAWHLRQLRVPEAWAATGATGAGVRIGHLDTGVVPTNVELAGATLLPGFDEIRGTPGGTDPRPARNWFDPGDVPGHGTATASVIVSPGGVTSSPPSPPARGGTTPPGVITGAAQGVALEPFRVIRSVVVIRGGTVAGGITRAVTNGCDVITMSLGGFPGPALFLATLNAVLRNRIVVAAAGNYAPMVVFPAAFPQCIAVAGTNVARMPYFASSRGPEVDIAAPAERVWVSWPSGVGASHGTSFATPCVASIAALWLSASGGRSAVVASLPPWSLLQDVFRQLLHETATPFAPIAADTALMGPGIANAQAVASTQVSPPPPPPPPPAVPSTAMAVGPGHRPAVDFGREILDWLARLVRVELDVARRLLRVLFARALHASKDDSLDPLDRLVDRYGLELVHILMTARPALDAMRLAGKRLAAGVPDEAQQPLHAALDSIRRAASKTLAAALR